MRCLQVIINGMRVRIKLDEERIAELLQGVDASAIPGLMRHLGDVASLSFTPYQNGDLSLLLPGTLSRLPRSAF